MKEDKIKVVIVKPQQLPYEEIIENSLENLQEIVGGYIEAVSQERRCILICNEEGKIKQLPPNRVVGWDIIAGNFFITKGNADGDFISLTDDDVKFFINKFK